MKILHVLDHSLPLQSGYTFRTRGIIDGQRALGWETAHVTSLKQVGAVGLVEVSDGLRFYRCVASNAYLSRLPLLNQWEVVRSLEGRLRDVILMERPDLIHAHSPSLNGVAALRVGRRFSIPVVYECRAFWEDAAADHGTSVEWGPRYLLSRLIETWVFHRADAVTCICEGLRSDIVGRGINADKVTVIPNGVDSKRFSTGAARDDGLVEDLGLAGSTVLGFIGSFYAYEGLSLAIRALAEIRASRADVKLLLVGGGPQEAELRREISTSGMEAHVVTPGRVSHVDVDRYYALVDVLLYPRLPMRLTELVTPLKPLEAMAQGKLLVASDVGGHREMIHDGVTGRLFSAGSAEALAASVLSLLESPDSWESIRREGRAFVDRERSWAKIVERYRPIYEGLLSKSPP